MTGYMLSPIGVIVIALYSWVIVLVFWGIGRLLAILSSWLFGYSLARWVQWVLLSPLVLVLLSLPWLEEAFISRNFNEACQDAGVKIYRQVEVEGYVDATSQRPRKTVKPGLKKMDLKSLQSFDRFGYSFIEHMLDDGGVSRVERHPEGLIFILLERPSARYHVVYAYLKGKYETEEPIGWKLKKIERRVIDGQTGEILGRDTIIKRVFPFHEALLAGLFGPPIVMCPSPNVKPYVPPLHFPQSILKPISRN